MRISLSSGQAEVLSGFCSDVAKGLMLAGILGQGFVSLESVVSRVIASFLTILLSFFFLFFALRLKEKR